ncbi:RNA polymerase sigma factor [Kitasatospora sp. NPDC006697]|uniref:RNA polymerase sigma factor n=1 Tax=Kitasatospora sp. NPDC006697 TaxID=3364020 RepID=UPI00368BA439
MDDDELIARLAGGDDVALRELFRRHAPWLAARLRTVLPAADVEDVLQETFLGAWRSAANYRPQEAAGGWLWVIARRQAAMWLRRKGQDSVPVPVEDRPAEQDQVEAAIVRADLNSALTALGPQDGPDRAVWDLLYEQDRPVAQVAQILGVPEGTVKSRAHRVRKLLRAALIGKRTAEEGL